MHTKDVVSGAAVGVIGGYVGTKVMNPVTTKLYEMAPEQDKQREKAVSPGSPNKIGAQKAADALGVTLNEDQLNTAASLMPYTVGIAGGLLLCCAPPGAAPQPITRRADFGHGAFHRRRRGTAVAATAEVLMADGG
jgi:hypothetical protein